MYLNDFILKSAFEWSHLGIQTSMLLFGIHFVHVKAMINSLGSKSCSTMEIISLPGKIDQFDLLVSNHHKLKFSFLFCD